MSTVFKVVAKVGGAFQDVHTFGDPFGTGARFHIRRAGCKAAADAFEALSKSNPVKDLYQELLFTDDEVEVLANDPQRLMRYVNRKGIAAGRFTANEIGDRLSEQGVNQVLSYLDGWDNVRAADDSQVPFSLEEARSLLTNKETFTKEAVSPEVWEFLVARTKELIDRLKKEGDTGKTPEPEEFEIGYAYQRYIYWWAERKEEFRTQAVEAGTKNSETLSGGNA